MTAARGDATGCEPVPLGATGAAPAVVHIGDASTFGDEAEAAGDRDPERLVRGIASRVGDPVPAVVGGVGHPAERLYGELLAWAVGRVSETRSAPIGVTVAVPASWNPHRHRSVQPHLPRGCVMVPSAVAALGGARGLGLAFPDEVVGVLRVGGAGADLAVLRQSGEGAATVESAAAIDGFGGGVADQALVELALAALGAGELDPSSPDDVAFAGEVRRHCIAAKEQLSADFAVDLVMGERSIRLTRAELERAARPALQDLAHVAARFLHTCDPSPTRLVLHGGGALMPLITEVLSQTTALPISLLPAPQHLSAIGAALLARPEPDAQAVPVAAPTLTITAPDGHHLRVDLSAAMDATAADLASASAAIVDPVVGGEATLFASGVAVASERPATALLGERQLGVTLTTAPVGELDVCVVSGPGVGRTQSLGDASVLLGRSRSADLRTDDRRLSGRHAQFERRGDRVTVTDLDSTNGTFLDGEAVVGSKAVPVGALVETGSALVAVRPAQLAPGAGADVRRWPRCRPTDDDGWSQRRRHPDVHQLLGRARTARGDLWERRPGHDDFLRVRVGWNDDPVGGRCVPLALDLPGVLAVRARGAVRESFLRHVVAQLVLLHGPDDLAMGTAGEVGEQWDWLEGLPHRAGGGAARVVVAHGTAPVAGTATTVLWLDDPASMPDAVLVDIDEDAGEVRLPGDPPRVGRPDLLDYEEARVIGEAVRRLRLA